MTEPTTRLVRVSEGAMLAGVLAGLARWLGWDVTVVRIVFVICTILSAAFPGILIYLIMWLLMPRETPRES